MNRDFTIPDIVKKELKARYEHLDEMNSFASKTDVFASWFKGRVEGFHNYKDYNGEKYVELERKSLNMAKYICESWASLLLNEKCKIVVKEQDKLDQVLEQTNFWSKANVGVEKSFALGVGALVVGIKGLKVGELTGKINTDKAKVQINFVEGNRIIPLVIDDEEIIECAFFSRTENDYILVAHVRDETGNYIIHNFVFDGKTFDIKDEYVFNTENKIKWFDIIKPNIVDNDLFNVSDFEFISIFGNAIDVLKSIDTKYDAFDLEYVLGKKRMFVGEDAVNYVMQKEGGFQKTFDPSSAFFYRVPKGSDDKPILETFDVPLRYDAFIKGINADINYLTMKCGLGENYFKFDGSGIATATQIVSENSTLYRNVKKHEILLEQALVNLTRAIMYASNQFTPVKFPNWEKEDIEILFDDSIIEDKGAEMERDKNLVGAGLMGKLEFRMKWLGETEEVAQENMLKYLLPETIQRYMPIMASGLMTAEKFVELVYPNETGNQELIEYIKENVTKAPMEDMDFVYQGNESGGDNVNEDE